MVQTAINNSQQIAIAGGLADTPGLNRLVDTFTNNCKQSEEYSVTALSTATTTITIDSNAVSYTDGATETAAEIAAGLIAAINADTTVSAIVTAEEGSATDTILVTADVPGTAFTGASTANLDAAVVLIVNQTTIQFGKFVSRADVDSDAKACLPNAATDITAVGSIAGITVREENVQSVGASATEIGYPHREAMSVMRQGRIWVLVEDAVTRGAAVYVRYTVNGATTVGSFRSDGDTSKAAIYPSAVYDSAASAGGLAMVLVTYP